MGSTPSSPSSSEEQEGDKFWVPPNVAQRKRAQSLVPFTLHRSSIDDGSSGTPTPTSAAAVRDLAFYFPPSKSDSETGAERASPAAKVPDMSPCVSKLRQRRASMHDAIDYTKIDTKLYDKILVRNKSVPSIQEEGRGTLNFSIHYNKDKSLLTVKIIQARDLVPCENNGTVDPFCKVSILPKRWNQLNGKVLKSTLNPKFEEEFVFEMPAGDLRTSTLEILLVHHDKFSRGNSIGKVQMALCDVDLSDKVIIWKNIMKITSEDKDRDRDIGDLMFSLSYLSSAERLTVVVVKSRNLEHTERGKITLDPYVKVTLIYAGKKIKRKKTTTKRNTHNPDWNEALVFNLSREYIKEITIELVIYHDNKIGNDEILGKVLLNPHSTGEEKIHLGDMIVGKSTGPRWHKLTM
ncbi:synaptotagmin-1 isoform X1 [Octopus bimaculoides]|nr:synaptotagmin-1 isoform X1 [Octopus bimaculoides]